MGGSVASIAGRERTLEVDFALVGHQESWRAAADVLAVLRGPERTPLPDDEIKDILPWIPPRAVCHVDVASIVSTKIGGAKARGRSPTLDARPERNRPRESALAQLYWQLSHPCKCYLPGYPQHV